jgi:hypothetical protein
MNVQPDHRTQAEDALANAQRNPVMSAEQSFLGAQIHALLAIEHRLEDIVVALREPRPQENPVDARVVNKQNGSRAHVHVGSAKTSHEKMQDQLDRAADDGWPDVAASSRGSS